MRINIKTTIVSFAITVMTMLATGSVLPVAVAAASGPISTFAATSGCPDNFIFPTWYQGLCDGTGNIKSPNDMGGKDTGQNLTLWISKIALNIVQILLYVVGYVSLGYIIYGGFKYMTNGDNSSGTASARKTIQNAVIGLVLSMLSVAIVKFVAGAIQ